MVTEHEESAAAEVAVELNEDLVGGAVDRLQRCVPTELTDLGGALVWTIPVETHTTYTPRINDKSLRMGR
jgi:hypothetical protein